jgi:hypothetical protein
VKTTEVVTRTTLYLSEVNPDIETDSPELAKVIAWADELEPHPYDLVMGTKSKAFGRNSSLWYGYERGENNALKVLSRLERFRQRLAPSEGAPKGALDLWSWSARFSLDHQHDPGFTGGLFQEHCFWVETGEVYARNCMVLDYTPETLDQVREKFIQWCEECSNRYENREYVTLDGKTIWEATNEPRVRGRAVGEGEALVSSAPKRSPAKRRRRVEA